MVGTLAVMVGLGFIDKDTFWLVSDMEPKDDGPRPVWPAARRVNGFGFNHEGITGLQLYVRLALLDMDCRA